MRKKKQVYLFDVHSRQREDERRKRIPNKCTLMRSWKLHIHIGPQIIIPYDLGGSLDLGKIRVVVFLFSINIILLHIHLKYKNINKCF